jgi:hypothetical protein
MSSENKNVKQERTQMENLKKWVVFFGSGITSFMTGCMCFGGCCGKIPAPTVLYDNDDLTESINQEDAPMSQCINAMQWFTLGAMGLTMIPLCCGYCCGCCGIVSPADTLGCD